MKKYTCATCIKILDRDSEAKIECPHCGEIVGCFYHKSGHSHIRNCEKVEE